MCPKGLDPVNMHTTFYTLNITVATSTPPGTGTMRGRMQFTFNGESFLFPANATLWDDNACAASFASLRSVETASCHRTVAYHTYAGMRTHMQPPWGPESL